MLPIGNVTPVLGASFSPDGKYIVTATWESIKKWNAISGQLVLELKGTAIIGGASFSPDGKYIVNAPLNNTPSVWNAESGQLVTDLKGHTEAVNSTTFSPNGKKIITASADRTAKVWDAISGKLVANLKGHTDVVLGASFSPDGKYIVSSSRDSTGKVWDAISGKLVANLKGHTGVVMGASFSPDGKYIVSNSWDSTGKVWDAISGKLVANLKGHTKRVLSSSFSPDSKYIVTTSSDYTAKVWDAASGALVRELKGHTGLVRRASFSPDGKYLVTASHDSTAKVWDVVSGKLLTDLNGNKSEVYNASFSPDGGNIVTSAFENNCKVWNALSGKLAVEFKSYSSQVLDVSFSPDGKFMVTVLGGDSTFKVWDAINGQLISTLKGHSSWAHSASFSPDGKYIVTVADDSIAKVWNAISGKLVANLKGHTKLVLSSSFSPDGKYIVTTSNDKTAKVWDAANGAPMRELKGHTGSVRSASFSPDGKYIVTASADYTAKVWNAPSGQLLVDLMEHTRAVIQASFSPDGNFIVTTSHDSTVKIWNTESGKLVRDLKGHKAWINNTSFSPDGKYIVIAYRDSIAKVWNVVNGQLIADLKGHRTSVVDASFFPDGKYIVTISDDNTTKIWDAVSWQLIKTTEMDGGRLTSFDFKNNRISKISHSETSLYDLDSGKKLYTFISVDSSDYLVYDKDNHYDGTEGARKLIYFTCGSEVIELEQVKDQLWVPNLAERILNGETINAAKLSDLNICNLTPVVDTIEQTALQYRFRITPRLGGLGATIVYVNGIEVKKYLPQQLVKQKENYQLHIDKKELQKFFVSGNENSIVVKSLTAKNSISSRSLSINEKGNEKSVALPNLYAVVVGVSDYKGEELDLKFAAKDAVDMANALESSAKKLLNTDGKEHVFIYRIHTGTNRDKFPEKNSIIQVFTEIAAKAQPNDILLVFFAGHGVMEAEKNQFYFLTADASGATISGALKDVGISTDELTEWIKPQMMKAQKRILIFDACNSGQAIKEIISIGKKEQNFLASRGDEKSKQIKAVEKLNERSGMFILSASASDQKAYEMGKYNQGALTYSLLKAIKDQPDILEDRKYLNISRWFSAAEKTVGELSRETGARQQPQIVSTTNFNIGVVDEEVRNKIVLPFEKPMFGRSEFRNTELRIDNLKLRSMVEKELEELSGNNSGSSILYNSEYDGINVYAINGDYIVKDNEITVSVILTKGGTEIKTKFELKGLVNQPETIAKSLLNKVVDWLQSNKN